MQKAPASPQPPASRRAHLTVLLALELVMAVQLVLLAIRGDVPQAVFVAGIMAVMAAPSVLRRHLPVEIPSEVEAVAVLFVFATLFLGEIHDYYQRFWWWDMTLHTGSGLLLGMLGFMIVYVLNEDRHVDMHMRPAFVALFAFFFAVGLGAIWEIFEFAMDRWLGTDMQPATAGDPSGLTDTMHDLIVDTVGALVVSLLGWRYLARARTSPIDNWAKRFIDRNPRLFGD
jgi:uncharacterized membrane protein YjdF